MAQWPITVVMQRRRARHVWLVEQWSALAVWPANGEVQCLLERDAAADGLCRYPVGGLQLELHSDENDGYFENWIAPQPKVFVRWQLRDGRGWPIEASVSYGEGARMLDSGDGADGVPMPIEIHQWLGAYLRQHHRPRSARRQRA